MPSRVKAESVRVSGLYQGWGSANSHLRTPLAFPSSFWGAETRLQPVPFSSCCCKVHSQTEWNSADWHQERATSLQDSLGAKELGKEWLSENSSTGLVSSKLPRTGDMQAQCSQPSHPTEEMESVPLWGELQRQAESA